MSERESGNKIAKGTKRYKDWIHKQSKAADHKNLPFTFSKPTKHRPSNREAICPECERVSYVSEYTRIIICTCGKLYKVKFV